MKKLNISMLGMLFATCSSLAIPGMAFAAAQQTGDGDTNGVAADNSKDAASATYDATGDIVVTASRRSQSLQDVPMSVDVASGELLQKLSILDIKDVQKLSPGLQLSNTTGRTNTATLRGVTFDPDQGTSPSVDLYVNEVPVDPQTAFAAIYDVDQIEVLRGPQGALRGRTAPAGAITIRTRRPDLDSINGYAQGTITDQHGYNVQGAVSLPIVEGKLALRAAVLVDGNRLNQVSNVNSGRKSESKTQSARLSLRWEPNSDIEANLIYQYLTYDNRLVQQVIGAGNTPALGSPDRSGPAAEIGDYIGVSEGDRRFQNSSHSLTGLVEWDMGAVTLSAMGAYQYSKLTQEYDQDVANSIPDYINISTVISPYKVTSGELRLASNNSGFWNWTIGAFYTKLAGTVSQAQQADIFFGNYPISLGLFMPIGVSLDIPQYDRTVSLAASSRFDLTQELTLEVGARYSDQKKKQFAFSTVSSPGYGGSTGIPARPPINSVTSSLVPDRLAIGQGKALTGGATLTYEISPALTSYVAYGRSFRLGSAGVGVPQNLTDDLARSGNERSDSVELGLKASLLDRRVTANLSLFYQKYKGYLARIPYVFYDFGARNAFGQAVGAPDGVVDGVFPSGFNYNGDATVKGIEATITARPTSNIDFSVGASYARGRFKDAVLPCNDFNGDGTPDTSGSPAINGPGNVSYCSTDGRLAEIPDFNLTTSTELRFPVGNVEPFVSGLVTYRPGFHYWQTNYDYRAVVLASLFLGVRGPDNRWEVRGFVKNMLNQKRVMNVIGQGSVPTAIPGTSYDSGYTLISATQPREFGAMVSFNF